LGSLITSNILTNKRKGTILLLKSKEGGEIKICVGKKLKKHLSIAKKKDTSLKTKRSNSRRIID
jgi:hypothetical protein